MGKVMKSVCFYRKTAMWLNVSQRVLRIVFKCDGLSGSVSDTVIGRIQTGAPYGFLSWAETYQVISLAFSYLINTISVEIELGISFSLLCPLKIGCSDP
jgi:hypothetical protein